MSISDSSKGFPISRGHGLAGNVARSWPTVRHRNELIVSNVSQDYQRGVPVIPGITENVGYVTLQLTLGA